MSSWQVGKARLHGVGLGYTGRLLARTRTERADTVVLAKLLVIMAAILACVGCVRGDQLVLLHAVGLDAGLRAVTG